MADPRRGKPIPARPSVSPPLPEFVDAPSPPCPVCGQAKTRTLRFATHPQPYPGSPSWDAHHKYYCAACLYIWSTRFKDLDLAAYGHEYVNANAAGQRVPNERMAASPLLLARLLVWTNGRRFLEYGIGYNTPYVEEVRSLGIDLWGCDISDTVSYEQHLVKLPEHVTRLGEGSFDGIFSQDVVEHFSNPPEDYRRLRSLLRPGGLLLSSTPVLEKIWNGSAPVSPHPWLWTPWHTSICSSRSMALLAGRSGFEFITTVRVPTDTGWAFLLRRPGSTGIDLDAEALASVASRVETDATLRELLVRRGWKRLERYAWRSDAEKDRGLYREVTGRQCVSRGGQ